MDASDNHLETTAATPPPRWSYAAATTVTTSQRPSTSYHSLLVGLLSSWSGSSRRSVLVFAQHSSTGRAPHFYVMLPPGTANISRCVFTDPSRRPRRRRRLVAMVIQRATVCSPDS